MKPESYAALPPGQVWASRWVIYAALGIPTVELSRWRLKVTGLVKSWLEYDFTQLQSLPMKKYVRPFHCVTRWSVKDVMWEGVPLRYLAEQAGMMQEARWVMFHCADGYTAPIPVKDALHEDSIIAVKMNGKPLSIEQGFPARPFIPHLYGWKSAKWLTEIEFISTYVDGYWEMYGYHERGAVLSEERFKGASAKHSHRTPMGVVPNR